MRYKILCTCALLAVVVSVSSAQTKHTFSGKCGKPENPQSIPAGDKDGHVFVVQQGKCETDKGEIGGAKSKDGAFSEHGEVVGNHSKVSGVYVETYDNGDKIFYSYQGTATTKDGAFVSGNNTWRMTNGTGKMKGIKGTGGCKLTPADGGGLNYACTGEYTLAAAKE
jgi:hypothetical protein